MELPGTFSNPMDEFQKGYDREFKKCSDLTALYDNALFREFFNVLWKRFFTLCNYSRSDILKPEARETNRIAANEIERLLNSFYTAIAKYNEFMTPESLLNRTMEEKKRELVEALSNQRRP